MLFKFIKVKEFMRVDTVISINNNGFNFEDDDYYNTDTDYRNGANNSNLFTPTSTTSYGSYNFNNAQATGPNHQGYGGYNFKTEINVMTNISLDGYNFSSNVDEDILPDENNNITDVTEPTDSEDEGYVVDDQTPNVKTFKVKVLDESLQETGEVLGVVADTNGNGMLDQEDIEAAKLEDEEFAANYSAKFGESNVDTYTDLDKNGQLDIGEYSAQDGKGHLLNENGFNVKLKEVGQNTNFTVPTDLTWDNVLNNYINPFKLLNPFAETVDYTGTTEETDETDEVTDSPDAKAPTDVGELDETAQTEALTETESEEVAKQYIEQLQKDFGLTKEQAIGVVANLWHESNGMNSGITQGTLAIGEPNGNMADDNQNGYGVAQWGGVRKEGLIAYAKENGLPASSQAANYGFLKQELSGEYSTVITTLKGAKTAEEAALIFCTDFEKASQPNMESRLEIIEQLENLFA